MCRGCEEKGRGDLPLDTRQQNIEIWKNNHENSELTDCNVSRSRAERLGRVISLAVGGP
jgi:hypothetical protein